MSQCHILRLPMHWLQNAAPKRPMLTWAEPKIHDTNGWNKTSSFSGRRYTTDRSWADTYHDLNKSPFWEESFWNNELLNPSLMVSGREKPPIKWSDEILGNGSDAAAQKKNTFILLGQKWQNTLPPVILEIIHMVFKQAKTGINYSAL